MFSFVRNFETVLVLTYNLSMFLNFELFRIMFLILITTALMTSLDTICIDACVSLGYLIY